MTVQKQATLDSVTALLHNPPMLLLLGVFTTAAGLAMVLAHNIWSGGALAVIVTVAGWLALIKGMLFLLLSPEAQAELFLKGLGYQQFFYLYMAITLALGIYLTYGGFRSTARL
jgi:vacuolar-type H+-ATPase subunit I/STV1